MISSKSLLFYNSGFHKFVANLLYFKLLEEPNAVERTFIAFQELMRTLDPSTLDRFVHSIDLSDADESILSLTTLLTCNRSSIVAEIERSKPTAGETNWILELSVTALRSILTQFSTAEMVPLEVICDDSKPLLTNERHLNAMGVNRSDFHTITFDERVHSITFSLARPIAFGNSKDHFGLQLADVASSVTAFSLKCPTDALAAVWRDELVSTLHENSVFPAAEELDLSRPRPARNACILTELSQRSALGLNLISGIEAKIELAHLAGEEFARSQSHTQVDGARRIHD